MGFPTIREMMGHTSVFYNWKEDVYHKGCPWSVQSILESRLLADGKESAVVVQNTRFGIAILEDKVVCSHHFMHLQSNFRMGIVYCSKDSQFQDKYPKLRWKVIDLCNSSSSIFAMEW